MKKVWWMGVLCGMALWAGCSKEKTEPATAPSPTRAQEATKPEPTRLKLALDWVPEPEFGGFYAARENGAYTRHGLEVTVLGGGAGAPVVQMVATGQADFGTTSADAVLTARARGVDVVPLFAVYQTTPHAIMVHASRGATSLAQVFSGGTIAMEPGMNYALFLKKKYGFDKVKIVPYDGGVARFLADKNFAQQCFLTSEPLVARKQGADPVVFKVADEGFNPYATVVVTRGELMRKSPDTVRTFVKAVGEGWRAYLDEPKQANAVMAKLNTLMDADTFAAIAEAQKPLIENGESRARGLGTMSRERWETLARQLVDLGVIEQAPATDTYLLPEFVSGMAPAPAGK